jgi:hypothetical protein
MNKTPIACDRQALGEEARKRHFDEVGPALAALPKTVRELANGFEFSFSPEPRTAELTAEWADSERLCCPFFNIEILSNSLRLTGGEGIKEFIRAELAGWFQAM